MEIILTIILAVLALYVGLWMWKTFGPLDEKKYFKDKLRAVQKTLWDNEFSKFKKLEMREEIRQQYDNQKSKMSVLDAQIAAQKDKPTMSVDEIKRLDDSKVYLQKDIDGLTEKMKTLDMDVHGSRPTAELPEGQDGLDDIIESLQELKLMLRDYIKQL